jgi:plasmid stability protein
MTHLPGLGYVGRRDGIALDTACFHNESMPNILVRDLPDDVHGALQQRAERQGQSLQQYLTNELTRLVERPTTEELFARVAGRTGGRVGLDRAVEDLEGERPGA